MSEIDKLDMFLTEHGVQHHYNKTDAGLDDAVKTKLGISKDKDFWSQIIVYQNGEYSWDAICGYGSYGYDKGLLEIAGSITENDIEGFLTANDIIKRLID